jgi:glycolate oxidase iron-sulfur subunit
MPTRSSLKHGRLGEPMTHAVQACVHCGFCLSVCPTYAELRQEMDSPRGRIVLMKLALEGNLAWDAAQPHIDRCLGCLACEPACPSGVSYRDLISPFRALATSKFRHHSVDKLRRFLAAQTIPSLTLPAGPAVRAGPRPAPAGAERLAVDARPRASLGAARANLAAGHRPAARRARVALLTGCSQVLDRHQYYHHRSLARNGVEVVLPLFPEVCWRTGLARRRLGRRASRG